LMPIAVYLFLRKYYDVLYKQEMKEMYGAVYEDLRLHKSIPVK